MKKKTTTQRGGRKATKACSPTAADAGGWREKLIAEVRSIVMAAVAGVVEEVKWRKPSNGMKGVPVWSHSACGIICTGEMYKGVVKLTFAKGASLADPSGLFNASLEGGTRRAIDIHEGEKIDARALRGLVKEAVGGGSSRAVRKADLPKKRSAGKERGPKLLSGGDPQIAKGSGKEPVRAYIAAMPGWKRDLGRRLDALIQKSVPKVRKAVKWNSPLYGVREGEWFLGVHCFEKYVKVAFFNGAELAPMPPEGSKQKRVRYLHVYEDGELDERQFVKWVKGASNLPGEEM